MCLVGVVVHLLHGSTLMCRFDMGSFYSSEFKKSGPGGPLGWQSVIYTAYFRYSVAGQECGDNVPQRGRSGEGEVHHAG